MKFDNGLFIVAAVAVLCAGCEICNQVFDNAPGADKPLMESSAPVRKARMQAHPDSRNWKPLFAWDLSDAEYKKGVWSINDQGDLTATEDSAIWTKRKCKNFILDFEYKLDPKANSGCVIYCSDRNNWIPGSIEVQLLDDNDEHWKKEPPHSKNGGLYGHYAPLVNNVKPAGEWNRMTIWAFGKRIRVAVNGELTVDADLSAWKDGKNNPDGSKIPSWLPVPWNQIVPEGYIGFQGKHGGACPYFRFIRIKEWN